MIWVTDAANGNKVSINENYIVAVYTMNDGELKGKTGIKLTNSDIIVEESDYDVIALIGSN
jgi:hypothetical protein